MDNYTLSSEFLRPLVNGWLRKLEASRNDRKEWKQTADECMMFYSNSAKAMWDPQISKKFWKGAKLPRFRVTINKAFEMVAIFGPNLMWEVPHRTVTPKRGLELPPELLETAGLDEQAMQMMAMDSQKDQLVAQLMQRWLNYTPREQPGGGLAGHSNRAVLDALIKGRGCLAARPYTMPESKQVLTGAFYVDPEDIFLDPDFESVDDCRWMAIKHTDVHSEVEQRFNLPKDSLKNKATLESSWQFGEMSTDDQSSAHRKEGKTNDLVIWYEIYSKTGCGISGTSCDPVIRDHLDKTVGNYAYLAICGDVPYPLNLPSEGIRKGMTEGNVKESLSWPMPYHKDDKWPVEFLDFYTQPGSAWPVAPLAPGLGELKLLNFLVSWFANRTWSSSRDFWAVAQPHIEHYKEYLNNADDQAIIPTPVGLKTPGEAIEVITQPETRQDMTLLINFVSDMFDKRVGLTPTAYGQNENNTQNRTAEETLSKQRAVMARPEYMQKQVVDFQSRIAQSEAAITRQFVKAQSVSGVMGQMGAMLWKQAVEGQPAELIARQFDYTVAAASIRRPNRERDIANYQQVMSLFAPAMQGYAEQSGNYGPFNGMVKQWADLHDATLSELEIPPPSEEDQQQKQQAAQLEMQEKQVSIEKTQAEAQSIMAQPQLDQAKMQADMQMKQVDAQLKAQQVQMKMAGDQQKAQMDMQAKQMDAQLKAQSEQQKLQIESIKTQQQLQVEMAKTQQQMQAEQMKSMSKVQMEQTKHNMEMMRDAASHEQEIMQDEEVHEQELRQKEEMAELDLDLKEEQNEMDLELKEEQAKIAAEQAKKVAQQKPKSDSSSGEE